MKWILIITIPFLILLIHCSHSSNENDESTIIIEENPRFIDLKLIKEKSIFVEDLDYPRIFMDDDQIFVDGTSLKSKREYNFYIYDNDLKLIFKKVLYLGQGPGELGGDPYFFPVDDKIYVTDNTQRRINIFDRDFNFIKFVNVDFTFNSPIFIKDGKSFIFVTWQSGKYGPNSSFSVYLANFPGLKRKLIHHFHEFDCLLEEKRELILDNGAIHYFLKDEKIYLLDKDRYLLTKRNISGKLEKQVKVNVNKIPVTKNNQDLWLKEQMGINKYLSQIKIKIRFADFVQPCSWMIPLEKGFVVIRKKSYSISCQGLVEGDYFDYNLNLLGKVKFPCFNEIFRLRRQIFLRYSAVRKNILYLVNNVNQEDDEIIALEKWRISE
jgi:hypothetical protein